jgi:hypothetical protein
MGSGRPAKGSGRPTCEADPHLELATGSNWFDPEQKRSKRVVTPSTRGDPRVDRPSASLVCSATPLPPLPIVAVQIELVADQIRSLPSFPSATAAISAAKKQPPPPLRRAGTYGSRAPSRSSLLPWRSDPIPRLPSRLPPMHQPWNRRNRNGITEP